MLVDKNYKRRISFVTSYDERFLDVSIILTIQKRAIEIYHKKIFKKTPKFQIPTLEQLLEDIYFFISQIFQDSFYYILSHETQILERYFSDKFKINIEIYCYDFPGLYHYATAYCAKKNLKKYKNLGVSEPVIRIPAPNDIFFNVNLYEIMAEYASLIKKNSLKLLKDSKIFDSHEYQKITTKFASVFIHEIRHILDETLIPVYLGKNVKVQESIVEEGAAMFQEFISMPKIFFEKYNIVEMVEYGKAAIYVPFKKTINYYSLGFYLFLIIFIDFIKKKNKDLAKLLWLLVKKSQLKKQEILLYENDIKQYGMNVAQVYKNLSYKKFMKRLKNIYSDVLEGKF